MVEFVAGMGVVGGFVGRVMLRKYENGGWFSSLLC